MGHEREARQWCNTARAQEYVFLGRDMMRAKDYSEQTAQEIDDEVKRIIDEAYTHGEGH